jgi:hypothetical protein
LRIIIIIIVILTLSDVADADLFSKPLITIFRAHGLHLRLLRHMIEREIALTPGVSTLFRRNSMTSKMMTTFSRDTGLYYLVRREVRLREF